MSGTSNQGTHDALSQAHQAHAEEPLPKRALALIRRDSGAQKPLNAPLKREHLESAERLSGFLSPYPAAPVDLEDVAHAQERLGLEVFHQALWRHLNDEVTSVAQLYKMSAQRQDRLTHAEPAHAEPAHAEPAHAEPAHAEPAHAEEPPTPSPSSQELKDLKRVDAVYTALKRHKGVMSLEQLSEAQSGITRKGTTTRAALFELKRALNEANEEALAQGERPPFTFELTGEVGLSEWGVSSAMRAAEGRARRELEMYREQLYVGLSERLRSLASEPLSALLSTLLEALGYERVEVLNASQEGVALMAHHSAWGETLVLTQRARKPLGVEKVNEVARSLSALMADRALLISLSGFQAEAEGAQRKVQLLNERSLIELMIKHEVGVSSYALKMPFVDEALFTRLSPARSQAQESPQESPHVKA